MAKKTSATAQVSSEELFSFWRSVMSGSILKDIGGAIAEAEVPLELRMRASENLARYLVSKPKGEEDERDAIVTTEVLRLAEALERRASMAEIDELLESRRDR